MHWAEKSEKTAIIVVDKNRKSKTKLEKTREPKSLFKYGKESSMVCVCTREENGCYGKKSQPLEILFDSGNANNFCSFTKQDLISINHVL